MENVNKIIEEVTEIHPYKKAGNPESYSSYNEGWTDACDALGERLRLYFEKTHSEAAGRIAFELPENAVEWLRKGQRGISSNTIFGAISGLALDKIKHPPSDPDDFRRCYLLIKQVPEWKGELHKVAHLSETWKNVVDNWDKLSALLEEQVDRYEQGKPGTYEMYNFMKSIGC